MCKILSIPHIPRGKERLAYEFLRVSVPYMAKHDRDGIGYAGISERGLFGEVWLNPADAFQTPQKTSWLDYKLHRILGDDSVRISMPYRKHGIVERDRARALMLHTRAATCEKGIKNAHPFFRENTALIHNGVISNAYKLVNIVSSCDSETILNEYISSDVGSNAEKINSVADKLEGWYAVSVFTQTKTGWIADIFKETRASLICAWIKELNTYVFCTNESILRRTTKRMGMRISSIHLVKSGMLYRFDVKTGRCLSKVEFTPNTQTSYRTSYLSEYNTTDMQSYLHRWKPEDSEKETFDSEVERLISEAEKRKG